MPSEYRAVYRHNKGKCRENAPIPFQFNALKGGKNGSRMFGLHGLRSRKTRGKTRGKETRKAGKKG